MFRRTIVRQFDWFFFGLLFCLLVLTLPSNGETSGRDAQAAAGAPSSESANKTKGDQTMSAISVRYFRPAILKTDADGNKSASRVTAS